MDVPNVVGDWQEYQSEEWAGLRIRVHGLKKAVPARGRHDDAKGLTYVSFQVTFENRASTFFSVDLHGHPEHYDVRVGRNGNGAFVDEYAADGIRDFNLYPQRRVTATLYVAAPAPKLKQLDIQISPKIDEEPSFGYVWVGALGVHEGSTSAGPRTSTAKSGVASEVERFLKGTTSDD
ncbi:hypothetical protein AR457_22240 [Streptomyces agglomeratus]|uniref:hypothetical protein n=1 Tax=Streptomyces agglomeratus TaxID=285458 RepID=UPI000854BDE1|nr:hypothetical protein [Streptomyces agglomeratus]OEJ42364.1 hypothetical protein BGK70_14415 [Streptomyces agglomeratus]OEJ46444.1 hypothetical protein AR457_22240 [Streptomyces agglomeratus]OEJ55678.1 hypothetical protein BGK72_13855 [Streptomyces agglomeratus]